MNRLEDTGYAMLLILKALMLSMVIFTSYAVLIQTR